MKKIFFAIAGAVLLMCACNKEEEQIPVSSITLNTTKQTVTVGNTFQLSAVVAPSNATNKNINWSSTDASVASVNANGLVTGVKPGSTHIVAEAADGSGKKASCDITVESAEIPAESVKFSYPSGVLFWEGTSVQFSATVAPDNASNKTVVWSSGNEAVATVDQQGLVKLLKSGKVTITAKVENETVKAAEHSEEIEVLAKVASIALDPSEKSVLEGTSFDITATVAPDNAYMKELEWSSSDETVATVDAKGHVTTLKAGAVTITATATDPGQVSASCAVTVNGKVTGITLDCGTAASLWKGTTLQIKADVQPATALDRTVSWTSSNPEVASVSAEGLVTALADGQTTITVTANDGSGVKAECTVTVKTKVETITLNEVNKTLEIGDTFQLTAVITPDDATDKTVVWSSGNESVATVSESGLVKALKPGMATITATAADGSGIKATCKIIIEKTEGTEDYNQGEFDW